LTVRPEPERQVSTLSPERAVHSDLADSYRLFLDGNARSDAVEEAWRQRYERSQAWMQRGIEQWLASEEGRREYDEYMADYERDHPVRDPLPEDYGLNPDGSEPEPER